MALRCTATQGGQAPVISGLPSIGGTAWEGQILTATAAGVTGTPAPARIWQWKRSGVAIAGATAASYTLTALDVDATMTVVQTEVNAHGSDSAESTATGTVADAPAGTATIVLDDGPTQGIAPAGYKFSIALGPEFTTPGPTGGEVYDRRHHEVYYYWDFGETYTYDAPSQVATAHRNARYAYGSKAAHVFRTSGTHTVTCLVVEPDSGVSATATFTVTIANPAAVFAANYQTIVLDTTGAGLAAYPNATVVTSFADAITTLNNLGGGENNPVQVICRRAQSSTTDGTNLSRNGPWPTTVWRSSDEAGARFVLNLTGSLLWRDDDSATDGGVKGIAFQGIDFRGPWDSTTETGGQIVAFSIQANRPPRHLTFDDCRFAGFEHVLSHSGSAFYNAALYMNDTEVTDWRFYGLLPDEVGFASLTGCAICQHVDANAGGLKDGTRNNHSGIRIGKNQDLLIHSTEFYSRNDWFNNADTPLIWGQQPNLRYDTDGLGGGYCQIQASVFEGGANVIGFGTEQDHIANKVSNIVIEKSYFLATHATRKMVTLNKGGTTFRNNIMLVPDTPRYPGYPISVAINSNWDDLDADNRDAPQRFYSNTIINLGDTAIDATVTTGFTDLVAENNLFYQPNVSPVTTADGPLDQVPAFVPREKGYKHNIAYGDGLHVLQTAYATTAADVWTGTPQAGSDALGDALTDPVAYDDFFGNRRPLYPSRGALEMD